MVKGDRKVGPRAYLEAEPDAKSIRFGGRYINLLDLAKGENLDHGYLSRIFSGKSTPSIPYATKVAAALRMGLEEFLAAIEDRKAELLLKRKAS